MEKQLTLIPDANFEQALINLGYDTGVPDGKVPTANISSVTDLNVSSKNISDLTGIQDFIALTELGCDDNQLTSLDVSANTALTNLYCYCNQLTSLDVSENTALTDLNCAYNQLSILDISANTALSYLDCAFNQLTSLDVKNGNNTNVIDFDATYNPSLSCIYVDDKTQTYLLAWYKDAGATFVS